jgi:Tfp pilus assembly protein PilN
MRQINLLPKDEQRDLKLMFFSDQLIMFWIWVLVSLLLFISLTYIAKAYLSGQVADIEGDIALNQQVLKQSDNELLKQQVEGLNDQINGIKNLQSQHQYWSKALAELARMLSADVSLDVVVIDRASGKISIQGVAGSRESALKFWSDVHKTTYFRNIDFPLPNLQKPTDDPFSFSFFINPDMIKSP